MSEVLKKNVPDTSKDVCAERNEGVYARKNFAVEFPELLEVKKCPSS